MRIAIAGLGHVGLSVIRILLDHAPLLTARCGEPITLSAVSARDRLKSRGVDLSLTVWEENPEALARRDDVDIVIELMGGAEGTALSLAQRALSQGKHFITANKALIATHGLGLAVLAERSQRQLSFEGAVCGGIPILKVLREGMAANRIVSIRGILNGTCNYILTRMHDAQIDFASALAEAQDKGFAERNPATDIDGIDSGYKLALLSAVAFGQAPNFASVSIEGIRHISSGDLRNAADRGGRLKLVGSATFGAQGLTQRVSPTFVPLDDALARVEGPANTIILSGDFVGDISLHGIGAGGDATASAVVADIVDICQGRRNYPFGVSALHP
jgi:homoserine dehydrogenase